MISLGILEMGSDNNLTVKSLTVDIRKKQSTNFVNPINDVNDHSSSAQIDKVQEST